MTCLYLEVYSLQSTMRRSLYMCVCIRPWTRANSRTHNIFQSLLVFLVLCLILWAFVSEWGVYYWKSSEWEWPNPHQHKLLRSLRVEQPPKSLNKHSEPARTYYQTGDTHHYELQANNLVPGHKRLRERGRKSAKADKEMDSDHLLKVLILSDPHIMCSFDK